MPGSVREHGEGRRRSLAMIGGRLGGGGWRRPEEQGGAVPYLSSLSCPFILGIEPKAACGLVLMTASPPHRDPTRTFCVLPGTGSFCHTASVQTYPQELPAPQPCVTSCPPPPNLFPSCHFLLPDCLPIGRSALRGWPSPSKPRSCSWGIFSSPLKATKHCPLHVTW